MSDIHGNRKVTDASEHADAAREHAGDAAHHSKEAARHAGEAMKAGASSTAEHVRDAGSTVGRGAKSAASGAAGAAASVGKAAGRTVKGAASGVANAAGSVAGSAGAAAGSVGESVKNAVSNVASRVGGWWNSARDDLPGLPDAEVAACSVHFETVVVEHNDVDFETAMTAYALGYIAGQNPDYRDRDFQDVEPELGYGFEGHDQFGEGGWRDFSSFGYERGRTR
jgi:hypothetical protein